MLHFVITFIVVLATFGSALAAGSLSMQGNTGLLNTPSAEVTPSGEFHLQYSNQKELQWRDSVARQENWMFSVGILPYVEFGARVTEAPGVLEDLSAAFKIQIPLPKRKYVPSIAFGMQDVGGGAKFLQTRYVVATEELGPAKVSVGYGKGPDRMKGLFGGIELTPVEWASLLAEYDTEETNLGVRLKTPDFLQLPVRVVGTAKTTAENLGQFDLGLGIEYVIDGHQKKKQEAAAAENLFLREFEVSPGGLSIVAAQALRDKLIELGFLNIRLAEGDGVFVVEYENAHFNHNELDALGVVVGTTVATIGDKYPLVRFVIRKKGIAVAEVSAPASDLRAYYASNGGTLADTIRLSRDISDDETTEIPGRANTSWLRSSLVVYPGLSTHLATEMGMFDFVLSVKPEYFLNLWKGAGVDVRWDIPVAWSQNYDDGKYFRGERGTTVLDRALLYQAIKLHPSVLATVSGGRIYYKWNGFLNELMLLSPDAGHRIRLKHISAQHEATHVRREVYLASYRYKYEPLSLGLEVTGGKFWQQDTGYTVQMFRFFGDTSISLYYKDATTPSDEHVRVAGVEFSLPLTPRKDMKPYYAQVRGTNDWVYSQETRIVEPGEANYLGTGIGVNPQPLFELERLLFNRDRLSDSYLKENLPRLREAYISYGRN